MGIEQILVGIAGIIIGIGTYIKTNNWIVSLIPLILGLSLIILNKEEERIEKRKDK
jgi:cadmium resistance protein CadD (predicted permease)